MTDVETSNNAKNRPRRRIRFSVRGLLILATIIGLILANLISLSRVYQAEEEVDAKTRELRAEIQRLRHVAGYPAEPDPYRVQVIAIPTTHPDSWSWRVFVPNGGMLALQYHFEDLPLEALPVGESGAQGEMWRVLGPGMSTIHAELHENAKGERKLTFNLKHTEQSAQQSVTAPEELLVWRSGGGQFEEVIAGAFRAETYVPGDRMELLRMRPLDGGMSPTGGGPAGLVIWLAPLRSSMH